MIAIYNFYIADLDGSDAIYLEVDPILPPDPITEIPMKTYTSCMSFNYDGTQRAVYTHIINPGVPRNSGVFFINFKHLSKDNYILLKTKFNTIPPAKVQIYDYRSNILYTGATLKNIKSDYEEGVADTINLKGTEQRVVNGSFEVYTGTPA